MPPGIIYSNMNFPPFLAAAGFLLFCGGMFLALSTIVISLFVRKLKLAKTTLFFMGGCALIYFSVLTIVSLSSREIGLGKGREKYFCEIDCHLAYSILNVSSSAGSISTQYVVTLQTRFDERTTSSHRPKDAALSPAPRTLKLFDSRGRIYLPTTSSGTALNTALVPGESYRTEVTFVVPFDASGLKLLLATTPQWPDYMVIGDENSWLHKKAYFLL